jgi:hypothetical protein
MNIEPVSAHKVLIVHRPFFQSYRHDHYQYPVRMENGKLYFTTKSVYENAQQGKNKNMWGGTRKRQKISHTQVTSRKNDDISDDRLNNSDVEDSDEEEEIEDINVNYHKHKHDLNDSAWYRNTSDENHARHEKNFDLYLQEQQQHTALWNRSHKLLDLQQPIHSVQGLANGFTSYLPVFAKMTVLMLLFSFVAYEIVCNISESQEAGLFNLVLPLLGERLTQLWPKMNARNTNGSKSHFWKYISLPKSY